MTPATTTTIALNKPYGVLSRFTSDGSKNATLASIEPTLPKDVWPIGRLDADSEGLLVLSSDKTLVDALLSPKRAHSKTYLAHIERIPDDTALDHLRTGIVVDGKRTLPAKARLVDEPLWLWTRDPPIRFRKSVPTCWLELQIVEGRNRQVRKMTAAVGHPTLRLIRVAIGTFTSTSLRPGEWRMMESNEISALKASA